MTSQDSPDDFAGFPPMTESSSPDGPLPCAPIDGTQSVHSAWQVCEAVILYGQQGHPLDSSLRSLKLCAANFSICRACA